MKHLNYNAYYPLPTKNYKESIENILNVCKNYNLYGLGRWGQWQYLNVDHCIKQVLDFFENEKEFKFFNTIK